LVGKGVERRRYWSEKMNGWERVSKMISKDFRVIQKAKGEGLWWNSRSHSVDGDVGGRGKVDSGIWNCLWSASEI
jgi:hypothetical protein